MNRKAGSAALALSVLFTAGCASVLPAAGCMAFVRGGQLCLLPPAQLPPLDGAHMVTIDHDGTQQTFIGQLHIDARVIRLAGSSLLGPGLFSVSYNGRTLQSEPAHGPQRADLLIIMLELVMARQRALQPALRGMRLTQTTAADGTRVRELFAGGRLVAHIEISAGPLRQATIRFDIPPAHLSVLMQPLAARP